VTVASVEPETCCAPEEPENGGQSARSAGFSKPAALWGCARALRARSFVPRLTGEKPRGAAASSPQPPGRELCPAPAGRRARTELPQLTGSCSPRLSAETNRGEHRRGAARHLRAMSAGVRAVTGATFSESSAGAGKLTLLVHTHKDVKKKKKKCFSSFWESLGGSEKSRWVYLQGR